MFDIGKQLNDIEKECSQKDWDGYDGDAITKDVLNKARKLFVAASNYRDEEGNELYARAHRFYKNMGFEYQLTLPDYYTKGESKIISSIDFKQSNEHVLGLPKISFSKLVEM